MSATPKGPRRKVGEDGMVTGGWSERDMEVLLRLRAANCSAAEIAEALKRDVPSIWRKCASLSSAARNGTPARTASDGKLRGAWTDAELALLRRERAAGRDATAIADMLGRTVGSVEQKCQKEGIKALWHGRRPTASVAVPQPAPVRAAPAAAASPAPTAAPAPRRMVAAPRASAPSRGVDGQLSASARDDLDRFRDWAGWLDEIADENWPAAAELELVERLSRGESCGDIARRLKRDRAACVARFRALTWPCRSGLRFEEQMALAAELRRRACGS